MLTVFIWKPQRPHYAQKELQEHRKDHYNQPLEIHTSPNTTQLHNSDFNSITNLRDLLKSANVAFTPTQQTCY